MCSSRVRVGRLAIEGQVNATIEAFTRKTLLAKLSKLPDSNQRLFKLMYGRNGGKRTVEDAESMNIESVINEMPAERLDWALTQVENTRNNPLTHPKTQT